MGHTHVSGCARKGQGLLEYVLILLLIAVICIAAFSYLGRKTANTFPRLNELEKGEGAMLPSGKEYKGEGTPPNGG